MGTWIVSIITCVSLGQVATQASLATRFDAVVRSMMPEWVADADPWGTRHPHPSNEERFRWHKSAEQGPGLTVEVLTYESADEAEWHLRQTLSRLSISGGEIQGVGDHAVHVVMAERSAPPPWMGTVYARIDTRLMEVSGDKDGADVRALAAALAKELRKTNR